LGLRWLVELLLNAPDEDVKTFAELYLRTAHEEMVKPHPSVSTDGMLYSCPVSVAVFIGQTKEDNVCLAAEILTLLQRVQLHLIKWALV
jgi:hypothetical protein